MLEPVLVTFIPVAFLAFLIAWGLRFRLRHIDMGGVPPIQKAPFYASKCLIAVLWTAMILHAWGIEFGFRDAPASLNWAALAVWIAGFTLLFLGQLEMGNSFRIGRPAESTALRVNGLFRFSRNPIYIGLYATLLASVLHTFNPVFLLAAIVTIVVHHRIVLAEEDHLRGAFGDAYAAYCRRVPRYL